MPITLLLGGARSGKTSLAVELAAHSEHQPVTYIATAPRIDGDGDLAARIARHRDERPGEWTTIEEELDLVGVVTATEHTIVIDCLTIWVSNLVHAELVDEEIRNRSRDAANAFATRAGQTIVVSNEVGMGVHPVSEFGRRYRDLLGWVNQEWARVADTTLLMVAGRAIALHDPLALVEVGK